jgi:archaemetzincin
MEKILIVPLGDDVKRGDLDFLVEPLGRTFAAEVQFTAAMPLPSRAFDPRRKQYVSNVILEFLHLRMKAPKWGRILAVTNQDLTVANLNFVFGQADINTGMAIISLVRLRPEVCGDEPNRQLFEKRAVTEAVHEIGHTLGLDHCSDSSCVMFFSNTLQDTDNKGFSFCDRCQRSLPVVPVKYAR